MNNESLYIILTQYKKEHITEEEAVRLIDDLYNNSNWNRIIYPTYPSTWPQITYKTTTFPKFEVTCKQ